MNDRDQESLYDHAGGEEALHRLEELFYDKVLADPVLKAQFRERKPHHVEHLTWFTAESFGGPDRFTRELGFQYIIDMHRHLNITDEQRKRFVDLYIEAADEAGLPTDARFREALRSHAEFGGHVAQQNSRAKTDAELHPIRAVPKWQWPSKATATQPVEGQSISFSEHIKPLFRESDREAMKWRFDLWSFDDVGKHADGILSRLTQGSMPCDGAWPKERIALFKRWIESGKPK